ncbi:MAG TPA: pyridoxal phosphate-dependent aminotransferase, partial [Terriglobia bacterium]|nr:pyridoxal phosphate-dependent aminotransferase [Terriglobia bacterium]
DWPLTPNRLTAAIAERRERGLALLDLTESNPTRCGFKYDTAAILAALADSHSLIYQPEPRGPGSAREAVAGYYAERGIEVPLDRIFLTTSTSEAYAWVFRLLANPTDSVLVPQPSYPLFGFLAGLNDVELVPYPLVYANREGAGGRRRGWGIDLDALRALLAASVGSRSVAQAVLVVHPNNPTGSFVRADELRALVSLCRQYDLALIADEVFADYAFARSAPGGGAAAGGRASSHAAVRDVLTFTLSGLSKVAALPQMKLAWIVMSGPDDLVRQAMERLEIIADTYLPVSAPVAHALPRLLETRYAIQRQVLDRVERNRQWLGTALASHPALVLLEADGGWYAVLQRISPETRSDEDWAVELVKQDGVLVHPGHFYDFASEGYLVVSLLPQPEIFEEGARRVVARFD